MRARLTVLRGPRGEGDVLVRGRELVEVAEEGKRPWARRHGVVGSPGASEEAPEEQRERRRCEEYGNGARGRRNGQHVHLCMIFCVLDSRW